MTYSICQSNDASKSLVHADSIAILANAWYTCQPFRDIALCPVQEKYGLRPGIGVTKVGRYEVWHGNVLSDKMGITVYIKYLFYTQQQTNKL